MFVFLLDFGWLEHLIVCSFLVWGLLPFAFEVSRTSLIFPHLLVNCLLYPVEGPRDTPVDGWRVELGAPNATRHDSQKCGSYFVINLARILSLFCCFLTNKRCINLDISPDGSTRISLTSVRSANEPVKLIVGWNAYRLLSWAALVELVSVLCCFQFQPGWDKF